MVSHVLESVQKDDVHILKSTEVLKQWKVSNISSSMEIVESRDKGFVTKCFLIFIVDEVENFAAKNLLQVGVLVTYWEPCIIG